MLARFERLVEFGDLLVELFDGGLRRREVARDRRDAGESRFSLLQIRNRLVVRRLRRLRRGCDVGDRLAVLRAGVLVGIDGDSARFDVRFKLGAERIVRRRRPRDRRRADLLRDLALSVARLFVVGVNLRPLAQRLGVRVPRRLVRRRKRLRGLVADRLRLGALDVGRIAETFDLGAHLRNGFRRCLRLRFGDGKSLGRSNEPCLDRRDVAAVCPRQFAEAIGFDLDVGAPRTRLDELGVDVVGVLGDLDPRRLLGEFERAKRRAVLRDSRSRREQFRQPLRVGLRRELRCLLVEIRGPSRNARVDRRELQRRLFGINDRRRFGVKRIGVRRRIDRDVWRGRDLFRIDESRNRRLVRPSFVEPRERFGLRRCRDFDL